MELKEGRGREGGREGEEKEEGGEGEKEGQEARGLERETREEAGGNGMRRMMQ